ncbi:hypothetical protein ARMGADRAFT_517725 [Armillaria gallica]|uniref:Uncharacterized protein n=1 Tax=Armillaria gallica TaxID=47427 RepID=A0A2H3E7T6_ARMGA|nr:hypothetical protein ARMGADRAFT_517725 [Armillaria gallica]
MFRIFIAISRCCLFTSPPVNHESVALQIFVLFILALVVGLSMLLPLPIHGPRTIMNPSAEDYPQTLGALATPSRHFPRVSLAECLCPISLARKFAIVTPRHCISSRYLSSSRNLHG